MSGEDVQVPEWPPRHIHSTVLRASESKMVFEEIGFAHIWQNLNRDMRLDSLTMMFFSRQSFTTSSSDEDDDVGVRVDSTSRHLLLVLRPGVLGHGDYKTNKRFLFNAKIHTF